MLDKTQWNTVHDLVAWLDGKNGRSREEILMRLSKIGEEFGETLQAWIGVVGQNPRKGVTHTMDDVRNELCDVILTAAVALTSITDDPAAVFDAAIERVGKRSLVTQEA